MIFLDSKAGQLPRSKKDLDEHGSIQPTGVGISERGMIRGQQVQSVGKQIMRTMRKLVLGFTSYDTGVQQMREVAVEGDLSQTHNNANAWQSGDLGGKMFGAVANLLRLGLVSGRRATDDRGYPGVAQLEAVVACDGAWFASQAELVQDRIHKVAGAVASKGPACAIGSVGAGREAKNQNAGARIAKAGNRTGPVGLIKIGATSGLSNTSAILAKPGAAFTGDDGVVNLLEEFRGDLFA